jgi:hypothetical protein
MKEVTLKPLTPEQIEGIKQHDLERSRIIELVHKSHEEKYCKLKQEGTWKKKKR